VPAQRRPDGPARDTAAGRTDKPIARGEISVRAVWIAAFSALTAAAILSLLIGPRSLLINAVMVGAAWAYNLGLKSTWASGLMYVLGFAPIPAFATSTLPGQPWPTWSVTAAAGCLGFGAHFANVLPDLAADRVTGVDGLPQIVAARWGGLAVRTAAIALLLAASVLLLLAAIPSRRWISVTGLAAAAILAMVSFRGSGKIPFFAALGIAAVDVALFLASGEALTRLEEPVIAPSDGGIPACQLPGHDADRGRPVRLPAAPLRAGRDHRHGGGP
jgi:4-hydroxybenzoate polyprenyltransferase